MSTLEIKDIDSVRAPRYFTFAIELLTDLLNPDLFTQRFRNGCLPRHSRMKHHILCYTTYDVYWFTRNGVSIP
jgi:hypothetical protein